jgi:hypothetical protein
MPEPHPPLSELDTGGYDADGYDRDGYDANGYDANGYNRDGHNENGYDADGNPGNVYSGELDLRELWYKSGRSQGSFLMYLREVTSDPEAIDNVTFCISCGDPEWNDETSCARGDSDARLCESCYDSWGDCYCCEDRYPDSELYPTLDSVDVCENCRGSHYAWCDHCHGYYHSEDASEHDHSSSCCTSPQQEFTIRNDGSEPLANDTRVTVTLPAGVISTEGLTEIRNYLQRCSSYDYETTYPLRSLSYDLGSLGDQWQTKAGNFAKRLSNHAYKTYRIKLPPEVMSQIGNIARDHSESAAVTVEATRDLNQAADYFYNDGSCWWSSNSESRCALKTNGGFGLRTFNEWGSVSGRAWVLPLRQNARGALVPTFDTMTPDAFVVFNGYGDLNGYAAPRILAYMAGWTYRKIGFRCEPIYVNAGGYLVAPEDIVKKFNDGNSLSLDVVRHASLFRIEQAKMAATEKEASDVRS